MAEPITIRGLLDEIKSACENIRINADSVSLNTDGLESIASEGNANTLAIYNKLVEIKAFVDEIEAIGEDQINQLQAILTELDTLNTTQTSGAQQTNIYGSLTKKCVTVAATDTTIVTPGAGQKVRLYKFSYSADGGNATGAVVSLKFGSNNPIDKQWLDPKQPYADGLTMRYIDGGTGEALKVDLSASVSPGIYVNVAYQLI